MPAFRRGHRRAWRVSVRSGRARGEYRYRNSARSIRAARSETADRERTRQRRGDECGHQHEIFRIRNRFVSAMFNSILNVAFHSTLNGRLAIIEWNTWKKRKFPWSIYMSACSTVRNTAAKHGFPG